MMAIKGQSFLSTEQITVEEVTDIFRRARLFKKSFMDSHRFDDVLVNPDIADQMVIGLVFFEPSTRTRMSFQMASFRLGLRVMAMDNISVSSVSKGESYSDTLKNINAMNPDLLVVRYGTSPELEEAIPELDTPVISAGSGTVEHPTQALLDAFTIAENRGKLEGERLLIVGDVAHSRVSNSNLALLTMLGVEVAYCAPSNFVPQAERWSKVKKFDDLNEGMKWADSVMGLRIQKERHMDSSLAFSVAQYRENYRIGAAQMKCLKKDGVLLHPGPVIRGVEISSYALNDPRCKVLEQVGNGVFVRAALLSLMLGLEVKSS